MAAPSADVQDAAARRELLQVLHNYFPGTTGIGTVTVKAVKTDDKKKTITVDYNEVASSVPFTAESYANFCNDVLKALGDEYADYKVIAYAVESDRDGNEVKRDNLEELVLFAPKEETASKQRTFFVRDNEAQPAPKGLDGSNIALWQSHGWYFEPKLNRWEFQRARLMQTVEDLYTQSYVMPYLMPMLRNAGAYVMSPRERDINTTELIVDGDAGNAVGRYAEQGKWSDAGTGFGYTKKNLENNDNPFTAGKARKAQGGKENTVASWTADFPKAGSYAVYVSYKTEPNSADSVVYTVNSLEGPHTFTINQKMGGGTWIYLGHFPFAAGEPALPVVTLDASKSAKGTVVTADAVKIGGGMGNVARKVGKDTPEMKYEYVSSRYPRFVEGARYFLQWAGAPDSVYTPTGNVNDYNDDYMSRALWVNWLSGGSEMNPGQKGLNVPVDLSFAFHSDAGTTKNDSIIGTLGIYCTKGQKLGNGDSRRASRDYTDLVVTNIVNDVRRSFEPNWTRRGMRDAGYYEARVPVVPAMLLELLSHQNFADMKYGLDPEFRFVVSRAIYKGMLQFLAHRDGREYVVTPLAPSSFVIRQAGKDRFQLSWAATPDSIEETAVSKYYLVQERIGNGGFRTITRTEEPNFTVTVTDSDIHSYRIVAGNDGGVSFPSEVLALCNKHHAKGIVNIVNGFTRISAPDWFDAGEIAGFIDSKDGGVPDVVDISYIGPQFEYRRALPWVDDDASGYGNSRTLYEKDVIAGNTHDFVSVHGQAIADAGYAFVSSSVDAFMNSDTSLDEPQLIDLILGKQKEIKKGRGVFGTRYKAFPAPLQKRITALTANGASFFISGAYVATDLWDNPNSSKTVAKADRTFATSVLGYSWRVGQAAVTGDVYEVQTPFKQFTGGEFKYNSTPGADVYTVESPDSFYPTKGGYTLLRYSENNLVAGTAFDNAGKYRTVVIGFPFETIVGADSRMSLMKQVLNFLDAK